MFLVEGRKKLGQSDIQFSHVNGPTGWHRQPRMRVALTPGNGMVPQGGIPSGSALSAAFSLWDKILKFRVVAMFPTV
jgi:hypothetical protein